MLGGHASVVVPRLTCSRAAHCSRKVVTRGLRSTSIPCNWRPQSYSAALVQEDFCSNMASEYDFLFKILLVGDSGVGKSCILMRYITPDRFEENTSSTIGVDFKVKFVGVNGKKCKLTIWDTAGQERFRTLTSSYYRGAQGIIFVYDVTRRETFEDLEGVWLREVDMYSTVEDSIKMVVANKTDLASARQVSTQEGHDFARRHGCLFVETSAKANVAVGQAFEELLMKVLETPALLETTGVGGVKLSAGAASSQASTCSC